MKKEAMPSGLWQAPPPPPPSSIQKQFKSGPFSMFGKLHPALHSRSVSPYAPFYSPYKSTTISRAIRGGVGGPGSFVSEATGNKWLGMLADVAAMRDPERVAQTVEYIQGSPTIRQQIEAGIDKKLKGKDRQMALRKAYINYMLPSLLMPLIPVQQFGMPAVGGGYR